MKNYSALLLGLAFLASACSERITPEAGETVEGMILSASLSEETKTSLEGPSAGKYKPVWKTGDKISINGTLSNAVAESDNGKQAVDFTVSGTLSSPFKVLYPGTTSQNVISLPATQNYYSGSFDGAAAAAYGKATKTGNKYSAQMTNFCGILRFALNGSATLDRIEINSLGSEKLRGNFTLATNSNGFTGSFSGGTAGTLTYNCEGVTLSGSDTFFYVAIPAQPYSKGLEALVYKSDGTFMRLKFWGSGHTLANTDVVEFESKTFAAGRVEDLFTINSLTAENGGAPTAPAICHVTLGGTPQAHRRDCQGGRFLQRLPFHQAFQAGLRQDAPGVPPGTPLTRMAL